MESTNFTAFPTKSLGGMSIREYFSVRAPNEIPAWFVHVKNGDRPKKPSVETVANKEHQKIIRDWLDDGCYDLPEELAWFQKKWEKAFDDQSKWDYEDNVSRFFQWRVFFADGLYSHLYP